MKYLKFVYILIAIVLVAYWGVYFYKKNELTSTKRITEIKLLSKVINNGTTKQYEAVSTNFEITNVGNDPLIIEKVTTDCNCTAPDWSKEPIGPEQKAIVKLEFNGSSLGYYQKKAMVYCNVENSPILLILRGYVTNK